MIKVTINGVQVEGPGRKLIDKASDTVTYVGVAACGSRKADRAWLIERITFDASGNPTEVVTGDRGAAAIWDERALLEYSDD
jgi:hypothetical protein